MRRVGYGATLFLVLVACEERFSEECPPGTHAEGKDCVRTEVVGAGSGGTASAGKGGAGQAGSALGGSPGAGGSNTSSGGAAGAGSGFAGSSGAGGAGKSGSGGVAGTVGKSGSGGAASSAGVAGQSIGGSAGSGGGAAGMQTGGSAVGLGGGGAGGSGAAGKAGGQGGSSGAAGGGGAGSGGAAGGAGTAGAAGVGGGCDVTLCATPPDCFDATCTAAGCDSKPSAAQTPCSGGVCDGAGTCVECVPKSTECVGNVLRTCTDGAAWNAGQVCPLTCAAGACTSVVRLSAAGLDKFVALLSDGTARAFSPPLSALPNPPPPPDTVASILPPVQGATDLAQGLGFYCFVTALGSVWCAGSNEDSRLGYDYADVKSSEQPLVVPGVVGAKRVFAGPEANGACAVLQDASVVCWGQGVAVPKAIAGISDVTQVARGPGVTFLRQSDGSVWAWGSNTRGQCGVEPPGVDVQGPTLLSVKMQQVQVGTVTACGVDLQDQIRCWGANDYGLLGTGTATSETATPQVIDMGSKFKPSALGVGQLAACASDASLGLTYCWGQKWSTTPKISPALSGTQTLGVGKAACGVFGGQISCWSNFYNPSIVQFMLPAM